MSFNPNLDKSTYLSHGKTTTGIVMENIIDGPQFWLPPADTTKIKTTRIISYLIPSAIVFGAFYIVFCDGKRR